MDARLITSDVQRQARIEALRSNAKPEARAVADRLAGLIVAAGPEAALASSANLRRQIEVLERGQY